MSLLAGSANAQVIQGGRERGSPSDQPALKKPPAENTASKPKTWFDDGMTAIRDKNPARAVALMKPLLADFEKRYTGEKRHIYCALNAAQSKAYLADAAKSSVEPLMIEPDWCRAQYVNGYALIDLGKMDEAFAVFSHLADQAPRNARYLNELGYVLSDQKKFQEAAAVYTRAVDAASLSPDDVTEEKCVGYRGLGYSMTKLGRLDDAEAAYRNCLAIDPDNDEVQDALDDLDEERKQTV